MNEILWNMSTRYSMRGKVVVFVYILESQLDPSILENKKF